MTKELTKDQLRRCQSIRDVFHTLTADECHLVAQALGTFSRSVEDPKLTLMSGKLLLKCMKREAELAAADGAEITEEVQKLTKSTENLIKLYGMVAGVGYEPEGMKPS